MAYIIFRDGNIFQKIISWLALLLFVLFFLRGILPISNALLAAIFGLIFLTSFVSTVIGLAKGIKAPVSEVMDIAHIKAEELKSKGIPVTGENLQKAIQEDFARQNGITDKS